MALLHEEKLAEIAKQIKKGVKPKRVSARTFIGWFGAQRRTPTNVWWIRTGLKKYNLITKPDFESVYIDSLISLQLASQEPSKDGQPLITDLNVDPTYRIGKLASANKPPVSVKPDALLSAYSRANRPAFQSKPATIPEEIGHPSGANRPPLG